jgi:succinate dehydrogenase flavin-adding protein (antitoxin of CptAB toxin-antitoxin module)
MKISKYTKLINYNNKNFIYSSMSNFLCEIDNDLYSIIVEKQNNNEDVEFSELEDNDIWELLKNKKIITESEADDILDITIPLHQMRRVSQSLNLTLTPTMDCNFYC